MVSANPTPTPRVDPLASFAKQFSWTLSIFSLSAFSESESVAVHSLNVACALQYSTSAVFVSDSVVGIMAQLVASTMSPNPAWWDQCWLGGNSPNTAFCLNLVRSFVLLGLLCCADDP